MVHDKCLAETMVPTIPMLFNVFVERIMTNVFDGHADISSIGGRQLANLKFADDIDGLSASETKLRQLVSRLERTFKYYGMEINGENEKIHDE